MHVAVQSLSLDLSPLQRPGLIVQLSNKHFHLLFHLLILLTPHVPYQTSPSIAHFSSCSCSYYFFQWFHLSKWIMVSSLSVSSWYPVQHQFTLFKLLVPATTPSFLAGDLASKSTEKLCQLLIRNQRDCWSHPSSFPSMSFFWESWLFPIHFSSVSLHYHYLLLLTSIIKSCSLLHFLNDPKSKPTRQQPHLL